MQVEDVIDTIIHGEAIETMSKLPNRSIDMVLCDLPYGTTACSWDVVIPFDKLWEQYHRIVKPTGAIVLFGQEPFTSYLRTSNIKNFKYDWYWEKENATNFVQVKRRAGKTVETISVFYREQCTYNPQMSKVTGAKPKIRRAIKGLGEAKLGGELTSPGLKRIERVDTGERYPTQVLRFNRDLKPRYHPTQKPVALCEYLIKTYTNEGDIVLDNCIGSGTTAVAAKNTDRMFIGIESSLEYVEIARKRLQNG